MPYKEVLTHALAHLSPVDLSSISLVSRRFHELVTTPHAWRTAFSRYFPGPDSLNARYTDGLDSDDEEDVSLRTERRAFARLSSLASWRSEYIVRTRLLRSLARGKPVQVIASPAAARTGQSHVASPITMYNLQMFTPVNHIHATFGNGLNKRPLRFIHGADDVGIASSSDPATGKVDSWGLGDPTSFMQFTDRYPADMQFGLGSGEVVGVPNTMDVSQPYGMVYGEGSPDGLVYFRFAEEMRGRFLLPSTGISFPALGVPKIAAMREAICSVWIAKSSTIPSLSDGLVGILAGSSLGVVTAYSLGPLGARDQRFGRGEVTARWMLSPGVPIIAVAVDEQYSTKRQAQNRIWAIALNALGELFYLTKFPKRSNDEKARNDDEVRDQNAWSCGRTVYWSLVEPSRRSARPNPYDRSETDGSYSPRSSWDGMCMNADQVRAETREIETFLAMKPKDFQRSCLGWDMRRRLEVDFANDDDNNAGELAAIFSCGLEEDTEASITRFVRCKVPESSTETKLDLNLNSGPALTASSLFGGPAQSVNPHGSTKYESGTSTPMSTSLAVLTSEEWRVSTFSFGGLKSVEITATSTDCSTFATLTKSEDPLLGLSSQSNASSPTLTPLSQTSTPMTSGDVPGQRARLVAAGTKMGSVIVWNLRASIPQLSDLNNDVEPIRIIHTDSPEISCLALTSLYLVHGGNDGLVQAWDPLASSMSPIRTLNSRFSSRARRRLVQAQASPQGVGINLFAAGAICLDPDATVLRGIVSIGTQMRYWSYSSSAADQYKSSKRRLRRAERGSNIGGGLPNVPRGNYKDYIANERHELEQEAVQEQKQAARLAGRFGTDLLGSDASEEEVLAYARLLSEESLAQEARRKQEEVDLLAASEVDGSDKSSTSTLTPEASLDGERSSSQTDDDFSAEMAEAIRLSLEQEVQGKPNELLWEKGNGQVEDIGGFDIPVRYGRKSARRHSPAKTNKEESSNATELSDLEFALQLSLAEEQSRKDGGGDESIEEGFPIVSQSTSELWYEGKGKGRAR